MGTGGGIPGCTDPSDCTTCTTGDSCNQCYSMEYQAGVMDYNNLVSCVFCSACYTTCQSAMNAPFCMGAPTTTTRDTGTPGMTACSACQMCSIKTGTGSCATELAACMNDADCKALLSIQCPM